MEKLLLDSAFPFSNGKVLSSVIKFSSFLSQMIGRGKLRSFSWRGKSAGSEHQLFVWADFQQWQNFLSLLPLSLLHLARDHRYTVNNQSSLSLSMRATALILGVLAAGVLLITNQGASALPVFETGTWQDANVPPKHCKTVTAVWSDSCVYIF